MKNQKSQNNNNNQTVSYYKTQDRKLLRVIGTITNVNHEAK